ncbi:MAG TPA: hypothetical protein VF752_11530 [Thermoleophilaceae bacterium]
MGKRDRKRRSPARDLRTAVECLPEKTRTAMLEGVREGGIIAGAYTDRDGGVCPMLAAHRRGGRTAMVSFARAWDRYTGAIGSPRRATRRELRTLEAMLEGSLGVPTGDLARVVEEIKAARRAEFEREAAAERDRPLSLEWPQRDREPVA